MVTMAMAMAMVLARGGRGDDVNGQGRREEEKTVALCVAGNLASTWCEGSGLCIKGVD